MGLLYIHISFVLRLFHLRFYVFITELFILRLSYPFQRDGITESV
jgi:hypothetical protein